jgi:hypothetical protein
VNGRPRRISSIINIDRELSRSGTIGAHGRSSQHMQLGKSLVAIGFVGVVVGAVTACGGATAPTPLGGGACGAYWDALQSYYGHCNTLFASGPPLGARQRFVDFCETQGAAPGVIGNDYDSTFDTCANAVTNATSTCADFQFVPMCAPSAGALADGAACGADAQCQSAFCKGGGETTILATNGSGTTNYNCGVCALRIPIGKACNTDAGDKCVDGADCVFQVGKLPQYICVATPPPVQQGGDCASLTSGSCDVNLVCDPIKLTCVPAAAAGASCDTTGDCLTDLVCVGADFVKGVKGTCGAGANVGAPCSTTAVDSGCNRNLACAPSTKTCAVFGFAAQGQPCDNVATQCRTGFCNLPSIGGTGTCPTILADGAPCDATRNDQSCDTYSTCLNGRCQLFDPGTCK